MNISEGLSTCSRESNIGDTRSLAGATMNHVVLTKEVSSILGLSDSEALSRFVHL